MHPETNNKFKGFIEIQDPEINIEEIMQAIESRLKARNISPEDIERISKIQFTPKDLEGIRKWDPAYTASLFEKGISVPKFTNPKLWFLKGPLKYLLAKFVEFYSMVDKKLSENRVRAFYQLLHEVILLKKKQEMLSQKIETLFKSYLTTTQEKSYQYSIHQYLPLSITYEYESDIPSESDFLLDFVRDVQPVLIYFPESFRFLEYCNIKNLQYKVYTPYQEDILLIKKHITDQVVNYEDISNCQSVLFHANAKLFSAKFWENILRTWSNWKNDLRFVIRYKNSDNSPLSPFADTLPLQINESLLPSYLRSFGFKIVHIHNVDSYGWTVVTFHLRRFEL